MKMFSKKFMKSLEDIGLRNFEFAKVTVVCVDRRTGECIIEVKLADPDRSIHRYTLTEGGCININLDTNNEVYVGLRD